MIFYCFVDIWTLFYYINIRHEVRAPQASSDLVTPALPHPHGVHGEEEPASPGTAGSQHQQELAVHVLEGDLGSHPGLSVRTVLLDLHLAGLPSVWPGEDSQRGLAAPGGELDEPEVQAGQGGLGGRDQLLEVELGRVLRGEENLLVRVASPLPVSPGLSAVSKINQSDY